ncbi:MAG: GNAT family N-acetyltransferase [Reinekea sp.]|nr:GNAT family N-acetyltransferase [Reinekea sp.]
MTPELTTRPAKQSDYHWLFELKMAADRSYVEPIFGWYPATQETLFAQEWQRTTPTIVCLGNDRIGSYCIEQEDSKCFFRRFVIAPAYRGRGYGRQLVKTVLAAVSAQDQDCHVAVFHGNPVIGLYRSLGFRDRHQDAHFHYLVYSAKD